VSLFRHSLDITAQMAQYYRLYRPKWPLPEQPVCLPRILAYAALTHDFGKIHVDFQAALRPDGKSFGNRHEVLSLAFLAELGIPGEEERPWVEAAVALHHKNLFSLTAAGQWFYYRGDRFGTQTSRAHHLATGVQPMDAALLHELLADAGEIFARSGWPSFSLYDLPPTPQLIDRVASIRSALQRIDGLAQQFRCRCDEFANTLAIPWPERRAAVQVRGFMLNSDHVASFGPQPLRVGLESVSSVEQVLAERIKEFNSHQRLAASQERSAILVAPTGSGKTEAGLLWAARQADAGLRGRTFVLLPYQASMNAMQRRLVTDFAPHILNDPAAWDKEVALVHGRSMRTAYERLLDRDYSARQAASSARVQNDLAHLNVAPIRVCSPYQVIRLLFATKGMEGLILSLSQSRLIFDEIHAYDPEVTALALTSAQFLVEQFGARVLFMTATLPSHLRRVLEQMFDEPTFIAPDEQTLKRPARHHVRLLPFSVLSDSALDSIRKAARTKSVLVVVNQVSRAIRLFELLEDLGDSRRLLHSRFTYEDRFRAEAGINPAPGRVLIATQAVEVSLDLDYETCFSELAPLESLLQRFGRCNRYGSQHTAAAVGVFLQFPPESQYPSLPYEEAHLRQTQSALRDYLSDHTSGLLEEKLIAPLLELSYPADLRVKLHNAIATKSERLKELFVDPFMPFGANDASQTKSLEEQWEELFDGQEVLPESLLPRASQEGSWLARARYLVPISGRMLLRLRRHGKVDWNEDLMCHVVKVPYTQYGLEV
jgi:CRISPR-associated endonuclease/helicase Cas3